MNQSGLCSTKHAYTLQIGFMHTDSWPKLHTHTHGQVMFSVVQGIAQTMPVIALNDKLQEAGTWCL